MNGDYVYPSIFLSYLLFFLCLGGAIFFFLRSLKDGYWGKHSEDIKYIMLAGDDEKNPENLETHSGDEHARS